MAERVDYFDPGRVVTFEKEITDLLGSTILQSDMLRRLAGVSMFGILDHLYHGEAASNERFSRYDHTLRVAHLTIMYCRNLHIPEAETRVAVIAALVHDVGHAPLSHSVELYHKQKYNVRHTHHVPLQPSKIEAIILNSFNTFPPVLRNKYTSVKVLAQAIHELAHGVRGLNDTRLPAGPDIRPNKSDYPKPEWLLLGIPACVDTFDGDNLAFKKLGRFQPFRLARGFVPLNPERLVNSISSFGVPFITSEAGMQLLSTFAAQRKQLYHQVFYSEEVRAAEAMVVRAMEIAIDQNRTQVFKLTDRELEATIMGNPEAARLWAQIIEKELYIALAPHHWIIEKYGPALTALMQSLPGDDFRQTKRALEGEIAESAQVQPAQIIISAVTSFDWAKEELSFPPTGADRRPVRWGGSDVRRASAASPQPLVFVPRQVLFGKGA